LTLKKRRVPSLTEHQHAELGAAHLVGADDDHVGGQALQGQRGLAEGAQGVGEALAQGATGHQDLHPAARHAGLQPRQPGQLGGGDSGTARAAQHGLQHDLLKLLPQRDLVRAWACTHTHTEVSVYTHTGGRCHEMHRKNTQP